MGKWDCSNTVVLEGIEREFAVMIDAMAYRVSDQGIALLMEIGDLRQHAAVVCPHDVRVYRVHRRGKGAVDLVLAFVVRLGPPQKDT